MSAFFILIFILKLSLDRVYLVYLVYLEFTIYLQNNIVFLEKLL